MDDGPKSKIEVLQSSSVTAVTLKDASVMPKATELEGCELQHLDVSSERNETGHTKSSRVALRRKQTASSLTQSKSTRRKTHSCTEPDPDISIRSNVTSCTNGVLNPRDRSSLIMISAALRSAKVFSNGMTRSLNLDSHQYGLEESNRHCAGKYFLMLADREEQKILKEVSWIETALERKSSEFSDEVCGTLRVTVGKARLFVTEKMSQFRGLCEDNLSPNGMTKFCDLNGFWAICCIQINDVWQMLNSCKMLRDSDFQLPEQTEAKRISSIGETEKPKHTATKYRTAPCSVQNERIRRDRLAEIKKTARRRMLNAKPDNLSEDVIYV